jgi:acetone carboxylase, gamma subunit
MDSYPPKEVLGDLIDGKLDWVRVKQIMTSPKDTDRFEKYLALMQERVRWQEKILLPLGEHLFVVAKSKKRIVKCDCGHEFGDWRENWKLQAVVFVRNTARRLAEIYPGPRSPDPAWCEIREFYCPGCGVQLEVENVPPGYPVSFDFLPDIDGLYAEWIGKPLGDEIAAEDKSSEVTRRWTKESSRRAKEKVVRHGNRGTANTRRAGK